MPQSLPSHYRTQNMVHGVQTVEELENRMRNDNRRFENKSHGVSDYIGATPPRQPPRPYNFRSNSYQGKSKLNFLNQSFLNID